MPVRIRKAPLLILLAFLLCVPAIFIYFHHRAGALPFDPVTWKSGDPYIRFRMKDDLIAKYESGEFKTRDDVERLLGPVDPKDSDAGPRYYRLTEWYGNPWYLRIDFDSEGKIAGFGAHPD